MDRSLKIAKLLLESNAVNLKPQDPYRYASGILSPIYCDNRILISLPEARSTVINSFVDMINELDVEFDTLAGTATAGIPHAAWIADKLSKPMVYVRQSVKDHGKKNSIEGIFHKGQKALVVEDLISTGGSSIATIKTLRGAGGLVHDCVSIFTYEMRKAKEAFRDANCKVHALTNFSILADVAKNEGLISEEDYKMVMEWNSDPAGWGRKMGFE